MSKSVLCCGDDEARKVLAIAKAVKKQKLVYWGHRRGWSNDRDKTLKHQGSVPLSIRFHSEWRKYFDDTGDKEENRRNWRRFVERHPQGYMFSYD